VVARLTRGVPSDKVLSTMTGTLPGDGRALTEAMWHQRGWRNRVSGGDDASVVGGGSGDVLRLGEATGKVSGELNQLGRLQRRRSLSRGGDSGLKSGGADSSPVA
jgi:hypothetical protein